MKKIIAMLLAVVMVLSMASVAFAADAAFTDVKEGTYCYKPVLWAVANGITNGVDDGVFAPNDSCTRGQVVTFLYRMAGEPELEADAENPFTDVKEGSYCYAPVLWAVANGITNGTSETTFDPDLACTRGQIVTFLYRYAHGDATDLTNDVFTDLNEAASYYEPVLWAVANGITNGATATTFEPSSPCTRGQIVTFLYRHNAGQSIFVDPTATTSLDVPAGESRDYHGYLFDVTMIVEGVSDDIVITYNDEAIEADEDGNAVIAFPAASGMGRPMPVEFSVENKGEEDASLKVTFQYPEGTYENPAELVMGENTAVIAEGDADGYFFTWTAEAAGLLTIEMDWETPWTYTLSNLTAGVYGDNQTVNSIPYFNPGMIEVAAGDEIQLIVSTFDPENEYNVPAGTVKLTASFEADAEMPIEEYIISGTQLELGENWLDMYNDRATTTVFEFVPAETGIYTFTAAEEDAKVGYWGASTAFCFDQTENKTNTLTVEVKNVGPSVMVGVSGVNSCEMTVARTGDVAAIPECQWTVYENTTELPGEKFTLTLGEGETLKYVDITEEHFMMYGDDGMWHLDAEDGPILYVDMDYIVDLSGLVSYGEMKMVNETDADGNPTYGTKYASAVSEYLAVASEDGKLYPLTTDLYMFYGVYGEYAGWWSESGYVTGAVSGTINPDTAWMFACCYIDDGNTTPEPGEPDDPNEPVVSTTLVLGDNAFDGAQGKQPTQKTYTATADGTLTVTVTAVSFFNGEGYDSMNPAQAFGRGNIGMFIGETAVEYSNTTIVEVTAGQEIVVGLRSMSGDFKTTVNLAFEAASDEPESTVLVLGDNAFSGAQGKQPTQKTYTATADGTVTVTVTAVSFFNGEGYDSMNPAQAFGRGNIGMFIGETSVGYSNTTTVEVTAGQEVVVGLRSMSGDFKTTVNIAFEEKDENADPNAIADKENVIFTDMTAFNGDTYEYTPASNGKIVVKITACNPGYYTTILDITADEWGADNYGSEAATVEFDVVAGNDYMIQVSSAQENGMLSSTCAGSVSYTITFVPAE